MKKIAIGAAALGAAYLAIPAEKVKLPFVAYVAELEFKLRRNGNQRLAKALALYDSDRRKR